MAIKSLSDGKVVNYNQGQFLLVEKPIEETSFTQIRDYLEQNRRYLTMPAIREAYPIQKRTHKSKMLLFDIETCGLSANSPVCAIAFSHISPNIRAGCLFARDYSEEVPMLSYFLREIIPSHEQFFTYNGTSFDLPRISERAKQNGLMLNGHGFKHLSDKLGESHVDLYPLTSRKLRKRLTDCKLQTIEKLVLGIHRDEDLPGSAVPREYKRFVNFGDNEDKMVQLINHGIHDTLTLAALLTYLQ